MSRTSRKPAPQQSRPSRTTISSDFTRLLGLQRHEPLTPEDRDDLDLIIAAAERGFRLATKCTACGHWLSSPKSIRAHMGPVCRARGMAE